MDFADVATFFNNDPVYDAYTGALLLYCHTSPHDDRTSSGATSRRRTMVTAVDEVAPARRAVTLYGEAWLVGNSNPDSFMGEAVRRSFDLKKSTGLVEALTPGQAALGAAGLQLHTHRDYFRDMQDARTSSDWDLMYTVNFAPGEPVQKGTFLRQDGGLLRVRNWYSTVEGLNIAEADQLDADAIQSATFVSLERDLVTELPIGAPVTTSVIQTDLMKFYSYRTQAEGKAQAGDRVVFVAQSALQPKVGARFTMQGLQWQVLAVVPEQDAYALHVRLV